MPKTRYLIIGGGIAGTTAADTIRLKDPEGQITIISDEPHRLYSRVMLSKPQLFLEKIPFEQVWLKKEDWYGERGVKLLAGKRATGVDAAKKEVTLDDGTVVVYDKLLIATGCTARRLPVPGTDLKGVSYLRTIDDAKDIISRVKEAKQAVTIGGGFISFEMCDMLKQAGLSVTNVIRESYFWEPQLDEVSGRMVEEAMEEAGVEIIRQAQVKEIIGKKEVEGIILQDGRRLECQMVIIGIGACLTGDWMTRGGIEIGHGIVTNEYLETNQKDIWAAGDAAEFDDLILHERVMAGTWVSATVQGRTAAMNMTGRERNKFRQLSYYTAHGFGMSIGFMGDVMMKEGRQMISRGTPDEAKISHFIIENDLVIGGTFVNNPAEMGPVGKLIELDVDVSPKLRELSDPAVDLKSLLPETK